MAKTYNTLTDLTTGDVLTETWVDEAKENFDNLIVPPMAQVTSGTAWSIPTGTATTLGWTSEHFDTDSMWTSGTALTVNTAGVYMVRGGVRWAAGSVGERVLRVMSGTVPIATDRRAAGSYITHEQSVSGLWDFAVGNEISLQVFHNEGSAIDVAVFAHYSPVLGAAWLGRKTAP